MKGRIVKMLLLVLGGTSVLLSGCAVENQYLAKLPLFEAKSDVIPGLDSPHQRKKTIQEKGTKGATASESEREILVAQLVHEYQTCPDPNMRREAVDALAKIPHPDRDRHLQGILRQDDNPFVRLSALEALGKTFSGRQEDLIATLIDRIKTDQDKDVRLRSVRILGQIAPKDTRDEMNRTVVFELGNLLQDKIPAVRYETMQSLQKVTGKDYGNDINRWLQYIRYINGEVPNLPPERTLSEKMPSVALPMFK
jgi:HEAT repeat protein